jgi:putative transposase
MVMQAECMRAESFNGRMRDELLNQHWWRTLDEAYRAVASYREDYNRVRPHSALGNRTPEEFACDAPGP